MPELDLFHGDDVFRIAHGGRDGDDFSGELLRGGRGRRGGSFTGLTWRQRSPNTQGNDKGRDGGHEHFGPHDDSPGEGGKQSDAHSTGGPAMLQSARPSAAEIHLLCLTPKSPALPNL